MLRKIQTREEGFAMVTAIMASSVVLLLSLGVVQLSLHNSTASGYDRKRVQAIDAAEAGIDYFYSYLQNTGGATPTCSVTKSLTASPVTSFTVTATYYNASNVAYSCPLATGTQPASVLIRSVGQSSATNPQRTMESYAKLTATTGSTFDNSSAIFGNTSVNFTANATIGGSQYNDADVYTNGSTTLAANSTLYGSLYAQGSITLGSNSDVGKDVWANNAVSMIAGSRVHGNATSSASSITLGSGARIYGNAKAATTITGGTVDGYRTQNSPSGAPPTRTYPTFTFVSSDWTASGYTPHTWANDCTTPLNASNLAGWWGAPAPAAPTGHFIRITGGASTCTLTFSGTINVNGNLAIITDGSVILNTNTRFVLPAGVQGPFNVYIFAGLGNGAGCKFQANPNSGFNSGMNTLIYVPSACNLDLQSNSTIAQGQVMGGTIDFKHTASFQFQRLSVPGTTASGFKEDVKCLREVTNGSALPTAPAC
jgi:Tfp pilus assembly protein PilX